MIQPDRCGLFEEAINYIRKIKENIHRLKRKRENLLAIQSGKTTNENTKIKVAGIFCALGVDCTSVVLTRVFCTLFCVTVLDIKGIVH